MEDKEGVKLTEITVTAASPDVIGTLMKRITDETMKLIPTDSIEKIAKEIIEGKEVIVGKTKDHYGKDCPINYSFSTATNAMLRSKLEELATKAIAKLLQDSKVEKVIEDIVTTVFTKALQEQLPRLAANSFTKKLTDNFGYGDNPMQMDIYSLQSDIQRITNRLQG